VAFTGDLRPEPANGISSNSRSHGSVHSSSPDFPRCAFSFADGRRCALPAAPQSNGLCYHHAHAPHRRLRPSDLIRELESISSSPIDNTHVHRLLAKIPAAVADGVLTPKVAIIARQLCAVMLQCALPKSEPLPEPRGSEWNFVVSILNSDDDDDAQLSPAPSND
jgi:hypothetical protein